MQLMIAREVDVARVAWTNSTQDLLEIPQGIFIHPSLRGRLQESPVLLPTEGWPLGVRQKPNIPPDWACHVQIVRDVRPDADRPSTVRPAALAGGTPDLPRARNSYAAVAARHQQQLSKLNQTARWYLHPTSA
jgi:hypothetical protein